VKGRQHEEGDKKQVVRSPKEGAFARGKREAKKKKKDLNLRKNAVVVTF